MFYCDKDCRKMDLKFHKLECKFYKDYYENLHDDTARLLLRLYLFLERFPEECLEYIKIPNTNPPQMRCFADLSLVKEGHQRAVLSNEKIDEFQALIRCFSDIGLDYRADKLYEYFRKISGNCFTIQGSHLEDMGIGIYVVESVFRHSCVPNASVVYVGTRIEVRAKKNIFSTEEITLSFVDLKQNRENREKNLLEKFVICSCVRCAGGADDGKFF